MACAKCRKETAGVFLVDGRELCGKCYEQLYPERVAPKVAQEAVNRRVTEKLWLRLVDLPGYKEWSAQYQGLDDIIHDLANYHILVHPDEFGAPLDEKFAARFQGWLDEYADRGATRRDLKEFKKA